jgi:subtilisin family serine protease
MPSFPTKLTVGPGDQQTSYELVPDQVLIEVSEVADEDDLSSFLSGASFETAAEPEHVQRARQTLESAGLRWVTMPTDIDGTFASAEASLQGRNDIENVRPIYFAAGGGPESAATPMFETVMIQIDDEQSEAALKTLADLGLEHNEAFSAALAPVHVFIIKDGAAADVDKALEIAEEASKVSGVQSVEFDWLKLETYLATPNDTLFGNQWNMEKISAAGAWDIDTGDNNIWIAVIDSGFDLAHPDLNFTPNTAANSTHCNADDFIAGNPTPYNAGSSGVFHGTACAGIAAATINNNVGVAGVAGGCQIMPVRLGTVPTSARVAAGINWARQRGARVCSLSLGTTNTTAAANAVVNAWNAGMILCAATGNGGGNSSSPAINFPANHANTIAVGASDQNDQRKRPASADGESWGSQYGPQLDVIAPGVRIWTTDEQGASGYNPATSASGGDYFNRFNGTSSATPHVAGLAALIMSANSLLSNQQVRDIIEQTCTKVSAGMYAYADTAGKVNGTWHQEVGYGRINAYQAVLSAAGLASPTMKPGDYTIRQKSNGRFVDAHEHSGKDFSVVTRTSQSNDTQRWILQPVGWVYTIQQESNGRFVDAHEHSGKDFSVVTRTAQQNDTQRWVLMHLDNNLCMYTIQQLSNGRYLDAHEHSGKDFSVVTRAAQSNDTQRWVLQSLGGNKFTIQQLSNGRFLDAHEQSGNDFSVVTRTAQNNDTQRWVLIPVGGVYTIQQKSNGRFVDAHEHSGKDFSIVTRSAQHNDTQRWIFKSLGGNAFTIQQFSNGRFWDAHEHSGNDFSVVTRQAQNNDTQRWLIDSV